MSILSRPKLNVRRKKLLLIAVSLLLAVPCVAAASFALRFDIGPQASMLGGQQEPAQQAKEKEERQAQKRIELEQRAEREDQELKDRIERETNSEVRGKLEAVLKRRLEERQGLKTKVEFMGQGYEVRTVQNQGAEREREDQELKERIEGETNPEVRAKLKQALLIRQAERELDKTKFELNRAYGTVRDKTVVADTDGEGWRVEREMEARQKVELAHAAKITMDQTIQIANGQKPGKVLVCSLIGEHWEAPGKLGKDSQVLYHVIILSGDDANPVTTHVLVNALDGTILKAATEEGRRKIKTEPR